MYETEEQQVEAIKKWWKENGNSVIAGIVLGLGGVLGWQWWSGHKDRVGAVASNLFDQMLVSVQEENLESAAKQRELLHQDFGSTPYAAFADLLQARLLYRNGEADAAQSLLQQVVDSAPDDAIKQIAVLRLARIRVAGGDASGAAELLDKHASGPAFSADHTALRGDIARAQGDHDAARRAYQEALSGEVSNAELIRLKLDNLPPAS